MAIGNKLLVVIDADVKGAIRSIDSLGDSAGKSLSGTDAKIDKFANGALKYGAAITAGAAVAGVALAGMAQQASDLNESITKSQVVFGRQGDAVVKWAGGLADSFGLSKREALNAAGAFGSMFRTSGLSAKAAATMSERMSELAGDMASFNNEDPSEMLDKLRSGLSGEAEPLRKFGVLLSEARVESFAYANGIGKVGEKLTDAQKVQARYGVILEDTKLQQGDFARTADGAANSQRRLAASWDNLTTAIGQSALPVLQKVVGTAADVAGGISGMDEVTGGLVGKFALLGTAGGGAVGGLLILAGALAKLKLSLNETATAMPKVAAAAKGLGALSVLAFGILEVKDAYDQLVASGEKNAGKFTDKLTPGSPEFLNNLDKAQTRLNNLTATYEKMGSGVLGQKRSQAFGEVFQQIAGADVSRGVLATSANMDKLSAEIIKNADAAKRFYVGVQQVRSGLGKDFFGSGGWINSATLSEQSILRVANALGVDMFAKGKKGRDAVLAVRQALIDAGGPTDEAAAAIVALANASGAAANASGRRKAALEAEVVVEKEAKKAIDDRRLALLASFNADIAAQQGAAGLGKALGDAETPLDKTAVLMNQAALEAEAMAEKLKAAGVDTDDAKVKSDLFRTALEDLGKKYPELKALIQPYIDKLNEQQIKLQFLLDHPNITTNTEVTTNAPELDFTLGKIERLVNYDGSTVDIYVKEHDDSRHGHRSLNNDGTFNFDGDPATGGNRALGGSVLRGKSYIVGERGPELLSMGPNSGWITPNNKLGGGNTYVINVNSLVPTAATGQLIREHLHKAERAGVTTSSVAG